MDERVRRWLPPASLAGLAAVLLAPGLWFGPWADNGVFLLVGTRIRGGEVPYRDIWDHKPPGAYLVDALAQTLSLGADPWLSAWLLSVGATALSALIVYELLRPGMSRASAWGWSVVAVVGIAIYPAAVGGGYTETYALPELMLSLWLVARAPGSVRRAGAVGVLLGAACVTSLQAVPAALAIGLGAVVLDRPDGRRHALIRRLAAGVAAALIVPALILVWLAAAGALPHAIDQLVVYNAAYRGTAPGIATVLVGAVLYVAGPLVPGCVTVARMLRDPRGFGRKQWLALAWAGGMMAYLVIQARFALHYFVLLAPAAVMLGAPGWTWTTERRRAVGRSATADAMIVLTLAGFAISCLVTADLGVTAFRQAAAERADLVAASVWIKDNTAPGTTTFVWGDDADLYVLADRPPYDAYVFQFPLVTEGYWSPQKTEALLQAWEANPPQLIVEGRASVALFGTASAADDSRTYDTLEPLRDFVRLRYRQAGTAGTFRMYVPAPAG